MGEAKGPFGGSSHSSACAEDVWAVWTNPAEWPGDVIAMAKIVFDRIEPLKPWGYLFGDEKDEKEPPPLKEEIKEQGHDITNAPEKA